MGEIVVITGLAQGMGREVAKLLAKSGDSVAGFDMDAESLRSLQKELDGIGGEHYLTPLDITDRKGILKFRDTVLNKYGKVDTVLSNVGIGFFGPFEEISLDAALKCFEINVIGASAIFQAFLPTMRKQRKGKLIAMSSLVGQIPFPFESIYTGSKFAIEGLVQSLQFEVKPFGIQVAMIEPAQVSTTFAAKIHKLPPENSPYRDRAKRFIDRDNELIKTAPTPEYAAGVMFKVLKKKKLKLRYQIDFMSTFFIFINKILPKWLRDSILVNYMDIKP
ncbi:MAG TPA: SDR family NAD(P)-dependent oxidoreductase [Spirochaetota bacterium]|nr:SDR family NAD(P)-dependent oxidoreductase [Spirochaetota bacterium]HQP48104.1 SDR family NAD(P)-dependent oxidoreductase [Spirochaetota bacterium]